MFNSAPTPWVTIDSMVRPVAWSTIHMTASDRLLAAHTLWLGERDVELLGRHGVTCIHNVNSNTKLASGYRFLYNELRDAGANVCIGTDGCASSNNLDMLEAMKTSAILQKAWREDPSALPLGELVGMATVNGAKALRFNGGVLAEGAAADISIVDTDNTFFLSNADSGPHSSRHLMNSASASFSDSALSVMPPRVILTSPFNRGMPRASSEPGTRLAPIILAPALSASRGT